MSESDNETKLNYLLSAQSVRERCCQVLESCRQGEGLFRVNDDLLEEISDFVIEVMRSRHPDLNIPYHSRWSHFSVGGVDRVAEMDAQLDDENAIERAVRRLDLVITSVLLDAGAGVWQYRDLATSMVVGRSEGLALASLHMFVAGLFSSVPEDNCRADHFGLVNLKKEKLSEAFQVSVGNPLLGLDGRLELIHQLGKAVSKKEEYFPLGPGESIPRPGNLARYFLEKCPDKRIEASFLLKTVLRALGDIWPGRLSFEGVNLGDVWQHPGLGEGFESYVPFHKLSQWLSYSMLEPLEEAGFKVVNLGDLTGLAEYRNGGLLVDCGLIKLEDQRLQELPHRVDSQVVIEWRALTVALLDEIGIQVRKKLGKSEDEFPLVKVLEGGTWWAGRKIASEKRSDASPPIKVVSDGTVF